MSDVCLSHSLIPQLSAMYGGYSVARERRYKKEESCQNYIMHSCTSCVSHTVWGISHLNGELNNICHLLTLLGAHHILHVSRIRIKCRKLSSVPRVK